MSHFTKDRGKKILGVTPGKVILFLTAPYAKVPYNMLLKAIRIVT